MNEFNVCDLWTDDDDDGLGGFGFIMSIPFVYSFKMLYVCIIQIKSHAHRYNVCIIITILTDNVRNIVLVPELIVCIYPNIFP